MSTEPTNTSRHFDVLIFDLFGVVIDFCDDLVAARLADCCASPVDAFGELKDIVSRGELIRGHLTLSDLHSELVERHGLSLGQREFEACWLRPYSRSMPGMAELIRQLAERYTTVLLSNVDKYYWGTLSERLPELRHFDHLVLSWQVGMAKPQRQVFELAVKVAGAPAGRCFFIDDKAENVEAARQLGLGAHRFTSLPDLTQSLVREGIL